MALIENVNYSYLFIRYRRVNAPTNVATLSLLALGFVELLLDSHRWRLRLDGRGKLYLSLLKLPSNVRRFWAIGWAVGVVGRA